MRREKHGNLLVLGGHKSCPGRRSKNNGRGEVYRMIHLVALERNPPRPIPQFIEEIKKAARESYYWNVMPDVWLVDTPDTAKQLAKRLQIALSEQDGLLVIRTAPDFDGWLPEKTWTWLTTSKKNLDFDPKL